jgi:hypothetical protein
LHFARSRSSSASGDHRAAVATVDDFVVTTRSLIRAAEEEGVRLRLLGSLAFRFHCPGHVDYLDAMERELTDIDFAASSKNRKELRKFFDGLGYLEDRDVLVTMEGARYSYKNPENDIGVDIFFDRLDFCHPVELGDRLALDSPTISLADLVLEKVQIVEINEKDIKDLIVCFLEHDVGAGDPERIDIDYIAGIFSKDWGFYHTATMNLEKVKAFLSKYGVLADDQRKLVQARIDALLDHIKAAPKSMRWKARARVGTKVRWYKEVSAKETTF